MTVRSIGTWYLKNPHSTHPWAFLSNFFTPEECATLKVVAQREKEEIALIGNTGVENSKVRKNTNRFLNSTTPELEWVYRRLTDGVMMLNQNFWNFDIEYIEVLQYTTYREEGDHYAQHMDMAYAGIHNRKLSFSLQLDDPNNYEGSDLEIVVGADAVKTKREQGTLIVFPSYQMHQVTPILSGERNSLVGWVCGPAFK